MNNEDLETSKSGNPSANAADDVANVARRCTKCRRPTKGHNGPAGEKCSMKPEDESAKVSQDDDETEKNQNSVGIEPEIVELETELENLRREKLAEIKRKKIEELKRNVEKEK